MARVLELSMTEKTHPSIAKKEDLVVDIGEMSNAERELFNKLMVQYREFEKEWSDEDVLSFYEAEGLLFVSNSAREKTQHVGWGGLSENQKKALVRIYGEPRRIIKNMRLSEYGAGERCEDNERALKDVLGGSERLTIWEDEVLVFRLYNENSEKIRALPGYLLIDRFDNVLSPGVFYTPKDPRRRTVLNQKIEHGQAAKLSSEQWGLGVDYGLDKDGIPISELVLSPYKFIGVKTGVVRIDNMLEILRGGGYQHFVNFLYKKGLSEQEKMKLVLFLKLKVFEKTRALLEEKNIEPINAAFADERNLINVNLLGNVVHVLNIPERKEQHLLVREIENLKAIQNPQYIGYEGAPKSIVIRFDFGGKETTAYLSPNQFELVGDVSAQAA